MPRSQISSSSSFSGMKTMKCFESILKKLYEKYMSLIAQNEILQIMAVLHSIGSDTKIN